MPRLPIDFSKTQMYKIVCNDLTITEVYVGHTTNWIKRKNGHKSCCNNKNTKKYTMKIYTIIRANGGWTNWSMVLIEDFPCTNLLEACKRERELYEQYDAKMNTVKPYVTEEDFKEKSSAYRAANIDKIKEKRDAYYAANRDKVNERQAAYHAANKEIINQRRRDKKKLVLETSG
jgi:hypothetical protein